MNAPHKPVGRQAVQRHRERMSRAGIARFEVKAPVSDKALVRRVAQALTDTDVASPLRAKIEAALNPKAETPQKGGLFAALRNSPLVGADVDMSRERAPLREVDF